MSAPYTNHFFCVLPFLLYFILLLLFYFAKLKFLIFCRFFNWDKLHIISPRFPQNVLIIFFGIFVATIGYFSGSFMFQTHKMMVFCCVLQLDPQECNAFFLCVFFCFLCDTFSSVHMLSSQRNIKSVLLWWGGGAFWQVALLVKWTGKRTIFYKKLAILHSVVSKNYFFCFSLDSPKMGGLGGCSPWFTSSLSYYKDNKTAMIAISCTSHI